MTPDDKDRCDVCMKMVDFRMKRIGSRRQHEWKVTVAVWALLAAGILKAPDVNRWVFAVGLAALSLLHFCWLLHHWLRSKEDIIISFFYSDRAAEIAGIGFPPILESELNKPPLSRSDLHKQARCQPLIWGQVVVTLFLAAAVWLIKFHPCL